MKRILIGLGAAAVIAITGFSILKANSDKLIARQIDKSISSLIEAHDFPDSRFEVIFCGTGSPQYNADRAQPCMGVIVGGYFLLFDAGQGAAQQLNATLSPFQRLDTVFLTHLHSDHMTGLGDVLHNGWLTGRKEPVDVVGPPGTQKVLDGIDLMFEDDLAERQNVLGQEYVGAEIILGNAREIAIDDDSARIVFNKDGVVVSAFGVDHPDWPHAYGYKVEFGGKSIVVSGDTKYTPAFKKHAQNTDYLIHEVVNVKMMEMIADTLGNYDTGVDPGRIPLITAVHTPTLEVAKTAVEANAKTLVLSHLIPPVPANSFVEGIFTEGMDDVYDGDIIVARDGMRLVLIE